ncbi:MAG: hypothetical protein ACOCVM_03940 [Desulfovibrionaceae bacterium]
MPGSQIARAAQEHMARAKAYVNKNRVVDGLAEAVEGVKLSLDRRVMGRQKIMLGTYINEFLQVLSKNSDVKQQFYSQGVYSTDHYLLRAGKERETLHMLQELHNWMGGEEKQKADQEKEKKQEGFREVFDKGMHFLEAGDEARARVALRKAAAMRISDTEVPCKVAEVFLKRNMLREAQEVCRKAIEANPANGKAYSIAVKACLQARDYPQAEDLYKQALKRFGAHPRTYLNMARMYLEWRKWSECYEAAKQAAGGEPDIRREAEEIMEKVSSRIFARR